MQSWRLLAGLHFRSEGWAVTDITLLLIVIVGVIWLAGMAVSKAADGVEFLKTHEPPWARGPTGVHWLHRR